MKDAADDRTMVIERVIDLPAAQLWAAWTDPEALPQWWGPDGFTFRTERIDLREGGAWVFDMIGPDGTVFPNHHLYSVMRPVERIEYALHWGENGPKHADATVIFEDLGDSTRIRLSMVFVTQDEHDKAVGFGAKELGLQTLGKLARYAAG